MTEFAGFSAEENAEIIEERKQKAVRSQGREAAVLRGRLYGEHTAGVMRETGLLREQRIARAVRYAEWEFDRKGVLAAGESGEREKRAGQGVPSARPGTSLDAKPIDPAISPSPAASTCRRKHLHHINHGGNPCKECGWPA